MAGVLNAGRRIRIGTRGSPLALYQANELKARLALAHGISEDALEIIVIRTTGDAIQDRPLSTAGGKGLFTKELDLALIAGEIDCAVHSAKDLPTELPDELILAGAMPREDVRDALITRGEELADLAHGAILGSASLRRTAMLLRKRPDLKPRLLRGNVETRLRKVNEGRVDVTMLAMAGLKRLGLADHATHVMEVTDFLPAVGQGAIVMTARADDHAMQIVLHPVMDAATGIALCAERAFLSVLDGSCRTPIAGFAIVEDGEIWLRGEVLRPDGSQVFSGERQTSAAQAAELGTRLGQSIKDRLPEGFFSALA